MRQKCHRTCCQSPYVALKTRPDKGVSTNGGIQNGWFIMENRKILLRWYDLGVPLLQKILKSLYLNGLGQSMAF